MLRACSPIEERWNNLAPLMCFRIMSIYMNPSSARTSSVITSYVCSIHCAPLQAHTPHKPIPRIRRVRIKRIWDSSSHPYALSIRFDPIQQRRDNIDRKRVLLPQHDNRSDGLMGSTGPRQVPSRKTLARCWMSEWAAATGECVHEGTSTSVL